MHLRKQRDTCFMLNACFMLAKRVFFSEIADGTRVFSSEIADGTELRVLMRKQTDVSLTLTKHVISTHLKSKTSTNMVFSPLSIQLVLGLIASGSNCPTRDQLLCFLRFNSISKLNSLNFEMIKKQLTDGSADGGPLISFANSIWIQQTLLPLKPSFRHIVDNAYKAASFSVDFPNKGDEVANQVNEWVQKETSDHIEEIFPPNSVDCKTRLVFANSLYFKGAWEEKFNVSMTKVGEFHLLNGTSVQVPFMTSKHQQYVRPFNGFKVLGLPYEPCVDGRCYFLYIYLPNDRDGLPALLEKFSKPDFLYRYFPDWYKTRVGEFLVPKFKISSRFEASNVLKELGQVSPFSSDNLTGMVDSPADLHVSSIFNKCFIEINEVGIVDEVPPNGILFPSHEEKRKVNFVADHPFLFLIVEEHTRVVMCTGIVLNPLSE